MADPEGANDIIAGKYRLTRLLGQGGMGAVWEGVHTSLGTRVAIKFIDAEHADSEEARSRFVNEAHAAARLNTKHVVSVYDQGVTEDGRPYIVMEFLAGEPLDRRLTRVSTLSPEATTAILQQVCRALTKAHKSGIVHRDLKPENVFLVYDDEDQTEIAKVVDFGIAKFTDASMGVSSSTRTGSVLGTPYYMSPEQARGLRSVDTRSDLWSLAVIGFRCMVGRLPFEGEAVGDLLVKICTSPIPAPSSMKPELSPQIDAFFAKAMAREPDERFQNADEMSAALGEATGLAPRSRMGSLVGDYTSGPGHALPPPPADASGPNPMVPEAQTVKAFTQSASVPKRGVPPVLLGAAAAMGLLMLGGVAWIAVRASAANTPEVHVATESQPAVESPADSASAAIAIDVAPTATEVVPPVPSAAPAPSQSADEKPAAKPIRPKPVSKPGVKPVAKPVPTPTPAPKPAPKPGTKPIDIGY